MDIGLVIVGGDSSVRRYLPLEIKDIQEDDARLPVGTILNLSEKTWNFERRFRWSEPSAYYSQNKPFGEYINWRNDLPIGLVIGVFEIPRQRDLFDKCLKEDPVYSISLPEGQSSASR